MFSTLNNDFLDTSCTNVSSLLTLTFGFVISKLLEVIEYLLGIIMKEVESLGVGEIVDTIQELGAKIRGRDW